MFLRKSWAWRRRCGTQATEMALLLTLMAVLAVAVAGGFGLRVSDWLGGSGARIESAGGSAMPVPPAQVPSGGESQPQPVPAPCDGPGEVCPDGSVRVGEAGDETLYTTPGDQAAGVAWNDGSSRWSATGATDMTEGATNTEILAGRDGTAGLTAAGDYPFVAARTCAALVAHGHDDWFLPAKDQLDLLRAGHLAGDLPGFAAGGIYWSSTEQNGKSRACVTRFAATAAARGGGKGNGKGKGKGATRCLGGGYRGNADEKKDDAWRVRCVRAE